MEKFVTKSNKQQDLFIELSKNIYYAAGKAYRGLVVRAVDFKSGSTFDSNSNTSYHLKIQKAMFLSEEKLALTQHVPLQKEIQKYYKSFNN